MASDSMLGTSSHEWQGPQLLALCKLGKALVAGSLDLLHGSLCLRSIGICSLLDRLDPAGAATRVGQRPGTSGQPRLRSLPLTRLPVELEVKSSDWISGSCAGPCLDNTGAHGLLCYTAALQLCKASQAVLMQCTGSCRPC